MPSSLLSLNPKQLLDSINLTLKKKCCHGVVEKEKAMQP
jgi:hypothetical protein